MPSLPAISSLQPCIKFCSVITYAHNSNDGGSPVLTITLIKGTQAGYSAPSGREVLASPTCADQLPNELFLHSDVDGQFPNLLLCLSQTPLRGRGSRGLVGPRGGLAPSCCSEKITISGSREGRQAQASCMIQKGRKGTSGPHEGCVALRLFPLADAVSGRKNLPSESAPDLAPPNHLQGHSESDLELSGKQGPPAVLGWAGSLET